jgi:2'-5' RNA ligase
MLPVIDMETKRIFIAAEFPEPVLLDLSTLAGQLWPAVHQGIRWVPIHQLHLTLKFIGDTPIEMLPAIQQICQNQISPLLHTPLILSGFGVFPNQHHPSVLWAGIQKVESIIHLQQKLEKNLASLGIPNEKRAFKPHLTLARIKPYFPLNQIEKLVAPINAKETIFHQETHVNKITIFESQLTPKGAIYHPLASFQLP